MKRVGSGRDSLAKRVIRGGRLGFFMVLGLIAAPGAGAYPQTPNQQLTPGDLCRVNGRDYKGRKYPARVPVCERNVDSRKKSRIYDVYQVPESCRRRFIIDHYIPLSIGGSNEHQNLWPQHLILRELTNKVEYAMFEAVRDGYLTQEEAVRRVIYAKQNPSDQIIQAIAEDCNTPDR